MRSRLILLLTCLLVSFASTAAPSTTSVAESMSRAEAALDSRDAQAAMGWLRPLLARGGLPVARQAETQWLLARAQRLSGDGDAAMQAADAAMAAARQSGDGSLLAAMLQGRALLALKAGRFETTVEDLAALEAMATEAEEPQLLFDSRVASTRLLFERGNTDRALERLSLLVAEARSVDLRAAYLAVGDLWLAKGDGARAASAYSTVLQADPDSAEAFVGRARARLKLQQAAGARADLAAAKAALPRQPSGLTRDLAGEALAALVEELGPATAAPSAVGTDALQEVRDAIAAGRWEDARDAAESAIMRDRNAPGPRAALAEVYLRQGEYGGAANVFSSMVGLVGESRYPRVGGTLAQGLMGVEVYDVEGFAEDWSTLQPPEQAVLREAVAAARQRGPLPPTAVRLAAIVEGAK